MKLTKVTQELCVKLKELTDAGVPNATLVKKLHISERTIGNIRRAGYNVKTYGHLLAQFSEIRRHKNLVARLKEAKRTYATKKIYTQKQMDKHLQAVVDQDSEVIGKMQETTKKDLLNLNTGWSKKHRLASKWVATYRALFFFAVGIIIGRILVDYFTK